MKLKKFLAVMVVFALSLSVFPVPVVAVAPVDEVATVGTPVENVNISASAVEVVALREECVKHFLLPDGTYKAVVYPYAVHTQDANGNWVEFGELATQHIGDQAAPLANFYPIYFDDGSGDGREVVFDTYITGSAPSANYGNADVAVLNTNVFAFFKTYIPNLPSGATLVAADLTISYYFEGTGIASIKAYEILHEWNETEVTWNSASQNHNKGVSQFPLSTRTVSSHTGGTASAPDTMTINITGAAKRWYAYDSENYGVALQYNSADDATMHINTYEGAELTRPFFTFYYSTDPDHMPDLFQLFIDHEMALPTEVERTDDGFFLLMRPLSSLLAQAGIVDIHTKIDATGPDAYGVDAFYDDWYLMAVGSLSGFTGYKYGLVKMRELEYDYVPPEPGKKAVSDQDEPGVSISFVALEDNLLISLLHIQTTFNNYQFYLNLVSVTGPGVGAYRHDADILMYFQRTDSKAPYLIADLFVEKIAYANDYGNTIHVSETIIDMINYCFEGVESYARITTALFENNLSAGYDVYNFQTHEITITERENLTYEEKIAILITHTCNVTVYSFAAEVQFHALAVTDYPYAAFGAFYERALRSDMGVGEDHESGIFDANYYNLDSELVQNQMNYHWNNCFCDCV